MHEFGVVSCLIEAATEAAAARSAKRVTRLAVRVGVLRQVDDRLLSEAFDILRHGTICADAVLEIVRCHARAVCPKCRAEFDIGGWDWRCRDCGADSDFIGGGDELELISIDAEVDE